jgi:hypothetical protein
MAKVLEIIEYVSQCTNAITQGLKSIVEHWPRSSPFSAEPTEIGNGNKS